MDTNTIQSLLTAVATFAAAVSALTAWQTLKLGYENRKYEQENGRPYFSFEETRMEQKKLPSAPGTTEPSGLNPSIMVAMGIFKNYGARPATDIKAAVYIISHAENIPPVEIPSSLADDFPPGAEWMVQFGEQQILAPNHDGYFIAVGVNYNDPVTKKNYRQMFFMKWPGIKDSIVFGDIVAATQEERAVLIEKHKQLFTHYA